MYVMNNIDRGRRLKEMRMQWALGRVNPAYKAFMDEVAEKKRYNERVIAFYEEMNRI